MWAEIPQPVRPRRPQKQWPISFFAHGPSTVLPVVCGWKRMVVSDDAAASAVGRGGLAGDLYPIRNDARPWLRDVFPGGEALSHSAL